MSIKEKFTLFYVLKGFQNGNHDQPCAQPDGWYFILEGDADSYHAVPFANRLECFNAARMELGPWVCAIPTDWTLDPRVLQEDYSGLADYGDDNIVNVKMEDKGEYQISLEGSYETLDMTVSATNLLAALKVYAAALRVME